MFYNSREGRSLVPLDWDQVCESVELETGMRRPKEVVGDGVIKAATMVPCTKCQD